MRSQNESRFAKLSCEILKSEELRPTDKLVFAVIMSYYRNSNSLIFPSYNTIAENANITRNTAIVCVKRLIACGVLQKQAQMRADGGFASNLYTVAPSNLKHTNLGILKATSHSNLKQTSHSNLKRTSNKDNLNRNNLFKINNTRAQGAQNATGEMLRTPESPEQKIKDSAILEIFSLSKCSGWVELVRIQQQYCLRPISDKVFSYINEQDFEDLRAKIAEKAGSCRGLKYGQHNEMEIIL